MLNEIHEECYEYFVENVAFEKVQAFDEDIIFNSSNKVFSTANKIFLNGESYYYAIQPEKYGNRCSIGLEIFQLQPNLKQIGNNSLHHKIAVSIHDITVRFSKDEIQAILTLPIEFQAKEILKKRYPKNPNSAILAFQLFFSRIVERKYTCIEEESFHWSPNDPGFVRVDYENYAGDIIQLDDDECEKAIALHRYLNDNDCEILHFNLNDTGDSYSSHEKIKWERYINTLNNYIALSPEEISHVETPEFPLNIRCNDIKWTKIS